MSSQTRNLTVELCREHRRMQTMIEELLLGSITPAAWEKKYKGFSFDRDVEVYVENVLTAEEGEA